MRGTHAIVGVLTMALFTQGAAAQIFPGAPQIDLRQFPGAPQWPELPDAAKKALMVAQLSNAKRDPSPSASAEQVHDYAGNYQTQGAFWGLLIGAVTGCVLADLFDMKCKDGVVVGAVLGAGVGIVVGSNVGKRQDVYASKEIDLNQKLVAAEADLADATATREAAERLLAEHRAKLSALKRQKAGSQETRDKMTTQIGYMSKDLEALTLANNGLKKQLESLNAAIAQTTSSADASKLRVVYTKLQAESTKLQAALDSMSNSLEDARIA